MQVLFVTKRRASKHATLQDHVVQNIPALVDDKRILSEERLSWQTTIVNLITLYNCCNADVWD